MIPAGSVRRTLTAVALVLGAVLLATACGSSSSSSASGSPTPSPTPTPSKAALISGADACTLVTATDISSAVGVTVTNMAGSAGAAIPGACFYGTADSKTTVLVFAEVFPDATSAASVSPEQMAAAMNGAYGVANAKVVTGIGDKAIEYSLTSSGNKGMVIFAFKSNAIVMIALVPAASGTPLESLARTAIGRLR